MAVEKGNVDIVKLLLTNNKLDINIPYKINIYLNYLIISNFLKKLEEHLYELQPEMKI